MHFFGMTFSRDIHRVQVSRALHAVALSFVSVYVPIYLLVHGYDLMAVIFFYVAFHLFQLFAAIFLVVPSMRRYGPTKVLRFSFVLSILFFLSLNLLPLSGIPWSVVAFLGGASNIFYWLPLNLLLLRSSNHETMGSDLGGFFALPKIFGIAGPIISALLIPILGFWPMFLVSALGLIISYIPLSGMRTEDAAVDIRFSALWSEIRRRRKILALEGFNAAIEESEWFWGIFVFLIVGTLAAPGLVGGLEALGGALFALLVGTYANRKMGRVLMVSALSLMAVWAVRFFVDVPLWAYIVTLVASFIMTSLHVSYIGTIYRTIKRDNEVIYIVVREIPIMLARMVVFGGILLFVTELRNFFFVPIVALLALLLIFGIRKKSRAEV